MSKSSQKLEALCMQVSFFYFVFVISNNQPGWWCWVQGSLLGGFQSLLGLSAHSTSLSRNSQTVYLETLDICFARSWFWYDWDTSDILKKKDIFGERSNWRHLRYICKHLIGDILRYLRYFEMSHYCDEVFVGYLFCICWCLSGELFVDVIIWKIFFMPFWKISNVDIFENMLLMQSLERYLFMPSFKIYIFMPFWKISNDNIFENMFVDEVLGKIFVNAIIWKIFFLHFWKISDDNIF